MMLLQLKMSGMYNDENYFPSDFRIVDLTTLEGCSLYCSDEAFSAIGKALEECGPEGVHHIDNGDYHYLSAFMLGKIAQPFDLVLFDKHSDDQAPAFAPDMLHCGGWVRWSREHLPDMGEVIWNSVPAEGGRPVYLSIDLDILDKSVFTSDWDQGDWTLEALLASVRKLAEVRRIIGVDVCGGICASQGACTCQIEANATLRTVLTEKLKEIIL